MTRVTALRQTTLTRVGWGAALASLLLVTAACRAAKQADLPPSPKLSAQPLLCRVTPGKLLRDIPATLYGTNLEWFNHANGIARDDGSFDPEWVRLAREQGIDNFRFPGGTLSDFYHWRDGIGPVSRRSAREHPTDSGRSPNVFGTPEFLRFCQAAGARPLITVNAGTSDAAEAAAWVAYCNQPANRDRIADGLTEPAGVSLWEVGNELYLPGNPTDKKIITVQPEIYAERFLKFSAAMRAADPTIKLMAIGTANSTLATLPYPKWSEVLLQKCAPEMDFIAVHNSYFPLIFGQKDLATREVYQSLWAAPEAVDRSLGELETLIARYEKQRKIGIAVTEWGALFSFDPLWLDHVKTMGSSVYLARLFQVYLGHPRVTVTNYFKFADTVFMGWVGYDQKPKIPYYVVQLFTQHFGRHLVAASVESPVFSVKSLGVMPAETGVPEVTVVASLDDTGRRLFLNFVNRSWDTIHQIKLDTGGFTARSAATTWSLSSSGPTDHNGRDIPPEVPAAMYREPDLSPGFKSPVKLEKGTIESGSLIRLPPFSILTIELDAQL